MDDDTQYIAEAALAYWSEGDFDGWIEHFDLSVREGPLKTSKDAEGWLALPGNADRCIEVAEELFDVIHKHVAEEYGSG